MALVIFALPVFAAAGCGAFGGSGDNYPSRDIEFIVPFSAGSGLDGLARMLAPLIEENLPNNVNVAVRNEPDAAGQTAASSLYAAEPDGLRIDMINLNGLAAGQLGAETNFELSEFTYLARADSEPYILFVAGDSEMISTGELRRAEPIKQAITGFAAGDGASMVILYHALDMEYEAVSREGSSEVIASVLSGDAQAAMLPFGASVDELEAGDLKPVLYASNEKPEQNEQAYEVVRDVPTIADLGYPELGNGGLELQFLIAAPPDLPEDIRNVLEEAIQAALSDPGLLAQAEEDQFTPDPLDAAGAQGVVDETLGVYAEYQDVLVRAIRSGQ